MSDIIAIGIVVIVVGVALYRFIRSFKKGNGKNDGCCGNCGCH